LGREGEHHNEFRSPIVSGAVQKQDGTGIIHLMFRDTYFDSAKLQIGQLWSSDYGNTWTGYSAFAYNGTRDTYFEYLGSQGYPNETVVETVADKAYYWQSANDGNTWQGPYSLTSINPSLVVVPSEWAAGARSSASSAPTPAFT
jgi:hypothetical protein